MEAGQSEPPSRNGTPTGTPTLHNFKIASPSDHSSVNTIPTPTSSELRANPYLPPTFQQRQDSILCENISVYNQYIHHIAHFGQQLLHNKQQVQVQHHQHHKDQINLHQLTQQ